MLNEWALEGRLEVTALSLATYPLVQDRYALLPHGASIGLGLRTDRRYARSAVSGRASRRRDRGARPVDDSFPRPWDGAGRSVPHRALAFDAILDEVKSGRADAGLLIHEGQLTYGDEGLVKVLDLGEWWLLETGLPLPLGVNVARRDVPRLGDLSAVLLESIARRARTSRRGNAVCARVRARPRRKDGGPLHRRCT